MLWRLYNKVAHFLSCFDEHIPVLRDLEKICQGFFMCKRIFWTFFLLENDRSVQVFMASFDLFGSVSKVN